MWDPSVQDEAAPDSHDQRLERVRRPVQRQVEFIPPGGQNARFRVCRAMEQGQCAERHHAVHLAAESIRFLATRVGPHPSEDIPQEIRRHQWSALNVPLLWAAAEGNNENPVVQWVVQESERISTVSVAGTQMSGRDAAISGESLRDALQAMGIRSREGLAEWIHGQGFVMPRWGAHFSARAQERLLNVAVNARCRGQWFGELVRPIGLCRRGERSRRSGDQWRWSTETRRQEPPSQSRGVPGLGGGFPPQVLCVAELSHHVKGRFRQVAHHVLEAQSHVVRIQDRRGEVRGWKLSDAHDVPPQVKQ